ncbi:MAG TPA: NAD+ synthase [Firmicutes bacterium]|nr:NAD+ synthase [Bacillota bacterium]
MTTIDNINAKSVIKLITNFIKFEITKAGFNNVVIGLSGGLDSSLSAYLSVLGLGKDNVRGLLLPYKTSAKESKEDALLVAKNLGIKTEEISITEMVDAYLEKFPEGISKERMGNIMARQRMIVLYDQAVVHDALVMGTSNKTEILLGYTTIWGDMACALSPLGDLYKTQARVIARELKIPEVILNKKPSADLWVGQTDEGDLGFTYEEVDKLLFYMVDLRYTVPQLEKLGYESSFITKVFKLIQKNQFKRTFPIIAKISNRTIDHDFRYPRDWGL